MTPMDRAKRVIAIDGHGDKYMVSMVDQEWRVILAVADLPEADKVAAITRHILARTIAQALADEDCRVAAQIDSEVLAGLGISASEVSIWCRQQAQLHVIACIP